MPVATPIQALLDAGAEANLPPLSDQPLDQARAGAIRFVQAGEGPKRPMANIEDRALDTAAGRLPVRVYTPVETTDPLPVVAYFHGGGWVIMGIDTHDGICRRLAEASGAVVVSVEYRLAPEHRYPAALDDCVAATQWLAEHAADLGGDPSRLAVAGDSAGGNLAAAVALRARVSGPPLAAQALFYPVTDAAQDTASYCQNREGYLLSAHDMAWFWDCYLGPDGDPADPFASPLRAADLSGLPPALVVTAEYDPLRDEGEAYARHLDGFDVPVVVHRFDGMIHGFVGMEQLVPEADAAMHRAGTFLRAALAG
jgi:acetyl esterase